MRLRWFALIVTLLVLLSGCAAGKTGQTPALGSQPAPAGPAGAVVDLTAAEFEAMLERDRPVLINVHVPYEGRIPGTDLEVPYDRIREQVDRLPADRGQPLAVYCMSGRMSEIAASSLQELGYTRVYNLSGGMIAWAGAGFELEDWTR